MHKKWHHHFSLSLKNLILNNFEILLDFCFRAPTGNEVITYKDVSITVRRLQAIMYSYL